MSVIKTFEHWLADGHSWIGVFENQDANDPKYHQRVAFCFHMNGWHRGVIGKSRGPRNRRIGSGERYVLVAKAKTVEEAVKALGQHLDPERLH